MTGSGTYGRVTNRNQPRAIPPRFKYPNLVRAIGACPPEDIGGFPGYADFLEAIADPAHEAHAEMLEWYGSDFDIEDAGIERILDKFEYLAKKRAPRPRKTPAKSRSSRSTPNPAALGE